MRRAMKAATSSAIAGSSGGGAYSASALPQLIGLLPGLGRARRLPLLEVAPVGNQRRIEGRRIALKRVLGAEEMSAGAHFLHRLHAEGILAHVEGLQELHHHLEEIDIE